MYLLLLLLFALPIYAQDENTENLHLWTQPPAGLNTRFLSHNINENQFQDCHNVFFDEDLSIVRRGGFQSYNTSPIINSSVRFIDEFSRTNGSRYMMAVSSSILAYTSSGTFVTLLSTLSATSVIWGAQYNDKYYIGETNGGSWMFDGATLVSTGIPGAKYAIVEFDKMFIANVDGTGAGSQIKYSRVGEPANFEGDASIYFNRDDGEEISGIRNYGGNIYVFKPHSIGLLLAVDDDYPENDGIVTIMRGVGCLYNSTIAEKDNVLIFQSERGVESFDGTNVNILSELIKPTIDGLTGSVSSIRENIDDSAGDFDDGASWIGAYMDGDLLKAQPISTAGGLFYSANSDIAIDSRGMPHVVIVEDGFDDILYSSYTDTTHSWSQNIVTGMATDTASMRNSRCGIALDSLNNPHIVYTFSNGSIYSVYYSSYTSASKTWAQSVINADAWLPDIAVDSLNNPHIIYASTPELLYSSHTPNKGWSAKLIGTDPEPMPNNYIKIDSNNMPYIFYCNDNYVRFSSYTNATSAWTTRNVASDYYEGAGLALDSSNNPHMAWINSSGYIRYSSYTATTKYLSISSYTSAPFMNNMSVDVDSLGGFHLIGCSGSSIYYSSHTVNKGFSYSKLSDGGEGQTGIELFNNQYPMVSFRSSGNDIGFYTGYSCYYSKVKDVTLDDVTFNGWGTFTVNDFATSLVNVNYYLFTANTAGTIMVSSIAINSGQQIISGNSPYIQYKVIWNVPYPNGTTVKPYIISAKIDWNINESPFLPCAIVKNRRYWLSAAESPSASNNIILILDKNDGWTKFTNMPVRSFTYFNNELYFGTADNTGLVYRYDDDYTLDTSSSIETMVKTKDFDLGSRIQNKHIAQEGLWIINEPTDLYANMILGYYVDKSTTADVSVDVSISPDTNYANKPIITRIRKSVDRFRYLSLKLTNFNKLNGIDLFYAKDPLSEE